MSIDDHELRESIWEGSLQTLEMMGQHLDRPEIPRLVTHRAVFRRKSDALALIEDLPGGGFEVLRMHRRIFRTEVQFTKMELLDRTAMRGWLMTTLDLVLKHRGDYDGWGAFAESRRSTDHL